MKILHTIDHINIAILNEINYVVFDDRKSITRKRKGVDETKHEFHYFSIIGQAVRYAAKMLADERANGLHEWLGAYKDVVEELKL